MAQRIEIQSVAVVFMESKHFLPKNMTNTVDEYSFACLPMAKREKNTMEKIISSIYKDNMQIKREKDLSTFYKINLSLLWFFNIVGYHRRLILVCFADDFALRNYALHISCCDNCLYSSYKGANMRDDSNISDWELDNVIMTDFVRYLETNKWHRHQKYIAIAKKIDIRIARF